MYNQKIIHNFCSVIECTRCENIKLQRDSSDNIPQPGYIGNNYEEYKLLLVGQNPGICPPYMKTKDLLYMEALKNLKIYKNFSSYKKLYQNLLDFVSDWPVQRNYFPLKECGLELEDIAYCNVVRCRTEENVKPPLSVTNECINLHFTRLIKIIKPKLIVCIGKWGYDQLNSLVDSSIPMTYMNRNRNLNREERLRNRTEVIETVKIHIY